MASHIFSGNSVGIAVSALNCTRKALTLPLNVSHRANSFCWAKHQQGRLGKTEAPEVSGTNFHCWLNPLVFGMDSIKLSHPPKIALWAFIVSLAGCDCSIFSARLYHPELEAELWAHCGTWKKEEGQFYHWVPHTQLARWLSGVALCRPECFHKAESHYRGVLTWTCVRTLFLLAGLVPKSQTCF